MLLLTFIMKNRTKQYVSAALAATLLTSGCATTRYSDSTQPYKTPQEEVAKEGEWQNRTLRISRRKRPDLRKLITSEGILGTLIGAFL